MSCVAASEMTLHEKCGTVTLANLVEKSYIVSGDRQTVVGVYYGAAPKARTSIEPPPPALRPVPLNVHMQNIKKGFV